MTYDAAVEGIVAALFITFYPKVIKTQVAPQSIFHGLAQIGGLMGLLKLFTLLTAYQQSRFEKELAKNHAAPEEEPSNDATEEDAEKSPKKESTDALGKKEKLLNYTTIEQEAHPKV